jgi:hypothetical protein
MESNPFFNRDLNPRDFNITFEPINQKEFLRMVTCFSSFPVETQIGRRFYFVVKNHNLICGFIRINSPVLSLSNRNRLFGQVLNGKQINDHILNGSVIVPVQPFGYNYLGGKLLTLVCISNEMTEILRTKVPDYCFFETSSLYGSIKQSSQYDGMEPYIRDFGLTQSKVLMYPTQQIFHELRKHIEPVYGLAEFNGRVCDTKGSTPKQREFSKLISIVSSNLKEQDVERYKVFNQLTKQHMTAMTQKRYYYSNLGYRNFQEHIINGEPLEQTDSSSYDFENLFQWWMKKAVKRYENLKLKGTFRTELEHYGMGTEKEMIR